MATARAHSRRGGWLCALAMLALAGCQTDGTGVLSRWYMAHDQSIAKGSTRADEGDDRNLMARWLSPKKPAPSDPNAPPALVLGPGGWNVTKVAPNPEADAEFRAAETLFQQGQLSEAETAFAKIAKKRKNSPWGEKAQYYLAETQFQRGNYVAAHDSYEKLVTTYPGTKYLEKLVARENEIAQKWLAIYDPKAKPDQRMAWYDRFTGQRPVLDTNGHALAVLEHVRHHDPTGPLADSAVLRIADYHYAQGDYESAALYYDQLITDHPKSQLVQRAQLASIDSKIKGYLGPDYDGSGLEQARESVKQTMATFPERAASTDQDLYHTLDLISEEQAARAYKRGDYYKRTGHVSSAEYYFAMVPQKWPNSPWAAKAKTQLAQLAKLPRTESKPSKIMTPPGGYDPFGGNFGSSINGMAGMGMPMMGMGPAGGTGLY
jgi:outer membrane protein assembly factor BamD (BamD/ComL family)